MMGEGERVAQHRPTAEQGSEDPTRENNATQRNRHFPRVDPANSRVRPRGRKRRRYRPGKWEGVSRDLPSIIGRCLS